MRARVRAAVGALVAIAVTCAAPMAARAYVPEQGALPAVARAASVTAPAGDGLKVETRAVYRVNDKGTSVHVEVTSTLTNQSPDTYSYRTYFHAFGFPIVAEAANTSAKRGDGTPLTTRIEPTEDDRLSIAVVELQPNIFYGQSQTVTLSYDLPDQKPRAETATRATGAFVSFPVFTAGDGGLTEIVVLVPDSFEADAIGSEMKRSSKDGNIRFEATAIADPFAFTTYITARDDDKLTEESIDVAEAEISVRAWPNDEKWGDFAAETVTDGLPELVDLIGLPWPVDGEVELIENSTSYFEGYAGWYLVDEDVIEVGDNLDRETLLHELSHAWFNNKLFTDRWVNEGLAEEMSYLAMKALGEKTDGPKKINKGAPGFITLNDWDNPSFVDDSSFDTERYGYDTSFAVVHSLVEEIGLEKTAAVLQAADSRTIPYTGDPEPEEVKGGSGWKRLLDYLVEVGGSKKVVPLFESHVLSSTDKELFAERTAARKRYAELEKAGGAWTPPLAIRQAMSSWLFGKAEDLMDEATKILATRDAIDKALADTGASMKGLEGLYETSEDLTKTAEDFDGALAAAKAIGAADDALDDVNIIGQVGVRLAGGGSTLDDAIEAFEDGGFGRARRTAGDAEEIADAAIMRTLQALVVVLVAIVLLVVVVRWLRRHHQSTQVPPSNVEPPPAEEPTSEPLDIAP